MDRNLIERRMAAENINWKVIPPASPHMGGAWERMVQSAKDSLKIMLKEQAPRKEVLLTLLAEAEHIVSSKSVTYISCSTEDEENLRPNHLLIGISSNLKPFVVLAQNNKNLKKQWRYSQ